MSPRAHVLAGALLAAFFIALYTVVGNEVNLILAVILAAVGFGIGAQEADQRDEALRAAYWAEERRADIAWWRGALDSGHAAEADLAPAMLAFLGDRSTSTASRHLEVEAARVRSEAMAEVRASVGRLAQRSLDRAV